jgi:hypothetical protein
MPGFVLLLRPPTKTEFELYVTTAPTGPEALAAVIKEFDLDGEAEVNGKPLSEKDAAALGLAPGEVRKL